MTEEMKYDIGGVYELVMVRGDNGFHGHYINKRTKQTHTFTASGMSKKQVLTCFWDKVRAMSA